MYSCHSILECYNLFSGVRLSMRSFCFIPGTVGRISLLLVSKYRHQVLITLYDNDNKLKRSYTQLDSRTHNTAF